MTNFCLHNEQMVNGLRKKIVWASGLCLPFDLLRKMLKVPNILIPSPHVPMAPCSHVPMDTLLQMENVNFRLLAANKKWKRQTSVCLLQTERENRRLFSLASK
jgi:hypothetical protein